MTDPIIHHSMLPVNGLTLHVAQAGNSGPLIVFLHGFPEFWYAWQSQLSFFGQHYRAVAPDMRGYNTSEKPEGVAAYQISHLVADVVALITALGEQRAILVAHDWGGAIAWAVAHAAPAYVEKLVIVNAPHPAVFARELAHNPQQQQASAYMSFFQTPNAEAMLAAQDYAALDTAILAPGRAAGWLSAEDAARYRAAWSQPGALTAMLNYYRAANLIREDEPALLHLVATPISAPTLVIWGDQDRALLTGNLEGLDQYVSNLTVRHIPTGTHWVIHEHAEQVNQLIQEFLNQ